MKLERRDALIALGALGLTTTAFIDRLRNDEGTLSEREVEILVSVGETLYPSGVDITTDFVKTYVIGQRELDPTHTEGVKDALSRLTAESVHHTGKSISDLSRDQCDDLLKKIGVAMAFPDPDGTDVEQIRYYIVNNLLYALYTTPKGGELVGNPNPPGYPGGTEAYQEGDPDE